MFSNGRIHWQRFSGLAAQLGPGIYRTNGRSTECWLIQCNEIKSIYLLILIKCSKREHFLITKHICPISAGIGKIPVKRSRTQKFRWNQANHHCHRDYLQFYGSVEHDIGADGWGERMRCQGIFAHRVQQKLFKQCYILLHELGHRLHHIWFITVGGLYLWHNLSHQCHLVGDSYFPVSGIGYRIHILVDSGLRFRWANDVNDFSLPDMQL